jgi:glycine/D-amino acid oxidase-like deaminating enzyme
MADAPITVACAGVAGLATVLLLARDGHGVTVVERDRLDASWPHDAPTRARRGIPHFLQPHAFIPPLVRARPQIDACSRPRLPPIARTACSPSGAHGGG